MNEIFLTEDYIPFKTNIPMPDCDWNPQRPDPPTPFWKLLGYQQCMGNTIQNLINWIGRVDSTMSHLAKMDTFSYYHGFELYLQQQNIKPGSIDVYVFEKHVEWANVMLQGSQYELNYKRNLKNKITFTYNDVVSYLVAYERPAGLGTTLTKSGHIITALNQVQNSQKEWLVVTDPYGHFPYRQRFGHRVMYAKELLVDKLSSVVMIQLKSKG
ncbi:MAG: hypothetical protein GW938_15530 [Leptospira sp.]|nr:hypothetical protein [Leptospira sp.]